MAMNQELSGSKFDYSGLDKDVHGKLLSVLRDINRERERHEESGMEMGKAIATAHALLAGDGGDGLFSQWVEVECGFSRQTAYNYMNAWQKFGDCKSLLQFSSEAMYSLASPKTPDSAVREAVKMANKGLRVTKKVASELRKKHCPNGQAHTRARGADRPQEVSGVGGGGGNGTVGEHQPGDSEAGATDTDARKLADKAERLYGELTRTLDQFYNVCPYHDKEAVQVALGMSYENFRKWKRQAA